MIYKTMGQKISDLLIDKDITQKELAAYCDCAEGTISDIIKDKNKGFDYRTLRSIANCLGVSLDYLVGNTEVGTLDADIRKICEYTGLSEKAVKNLNHFSPYTQYQLSFDNISLCYTAGIISVINAFLENEDLSPFNGIYFYKEAISKALDKIEAAANGQYISDSSYSLYQEAVFHLFTANENFTETIKKIVPEREIYERIRLEYSTIVDNMLSKGGTDNGNNSETE